MFRMKYLIVVLLSLLLMSCLSQTPSDVVAKGKDYYIVYHAEINNEIPNNGKYIYYINDCSRVNWTLRSDSLFSINDTLVITNIKWIKKK